MRPPGNRVAQVRKDLADLRGHAGPVGRYRAQMCALRIRHSRADFEAFALPEIRTRVRISRSSGITWRQA
jgi:hypothetical protein